MVVNHRTKFLTRIVQLTSKTAWLLKQALPLKKYFQPVSRQESAAKLELQ
jgi:hypothetical protein